MFYSFFLSYRFVCLYFCKNKSTMRKIELQHCINSLLLFMTFYSFGQVTTTITDLKVNNTTSTGITFNSNSTITAKFDVNLLTYNGASSNILGNIHIYIKKNATSEPVEVGWSPITFSVNYPPFVPQETYTNKTPFTIELIKSSFFASGGVLYAEYKNNNGNKYKSSNIAISGGTLVAPSNPDPGNPGNPGTPGVSSIPFLEVTNLRYAETNEVVKDFMGTSVIMDHFVILLPKNKPSVSLNVDFEIKRDLRAPSFTLCDSYISWGEQVLVGWSKLPCTEYTNTVYGTLPIDVTVPDNPYKVKDFSLHPSGGKGTGLRIYVVELEFLGTDIFAVLNGRGDNARVTGISGGSAKVIAGEVLDERRGIMRPLYEDCDQFRWFRRPVGGMWAYDGTSSPDINNITQPTEFFRRSFYKGTWVDSNIVLIDQVPVINPNLPVIQMNNTICCNQTVALSAPIATLIGNVPTVSNYTYKWQFSGDNATWTELIGANTVSKDFTPSSFTSSRDSSPRYYRRAVITPSGVSYSNSVKIEMGVSSGRTANAEDSSDAVFNEINVFPNPTFGVLNINGYNLEKENVKIFDITGRQIDPSGLQKNDNSIEMDISNLPNATYLLLIESSNGTIYKKIIKN